MIRKAGRKDLGAVAGPALKLWPHSGEPAILRHARPARAFGIRASWGILRHRHTAVEWRRQP